jgi:hypothetical protein
MHQTNGSFTFRVQVAEIGHEHHTLLWLKRCGRWTDVFGVPLNPASGGIESEGADSLRSVRIVRLVLREHGRRVHRR